MIRGPSHSMVSVLTSLLLDMYKTENELIMEMDETRNSAVGKSGNDVLRNSLSMLAVR